MKIPPEIIAPNPAELAGKTPFDNRRTEPISGAANLAGDLSSSSSSQSATLNQERLEIETERRAPPAKPAKRHTGEERRKENRRKENRPVLLDTRTSRTRRESGRTATIDFTI